MPTAERTAESDPVIDDSLTHEMNGHGTPEVETAASQQAGDAPAKDPIPPPTPTELRALHYQEVLAMGARVQEARNVWESLKKDTADAKKEFDGMTVSLLRLMRRDPLQRQLPVEEYDEFKSDEPLPSDEWGSSVSTF